MGSRNQELGLDIVFKYLVRYPSGGLVGSWICKPGVKGGDQNSGDASLEAVFKTVGPSVINTENVEKRTEDWALGPPVFRDWKGEEEQPRIRRRDNQHGFPSGGRTLADDHARSTALSP